MLSYNSELYGRFDIKVFLIIFSKSFPFTLEFVALYNYFFLLQVLIHASVYIHSEFVFLHTIAVYPSTTNCVCLFKCCHTIPIIQTMFCSTNTGWKFHLCKWSIQSERLCFKIPIPAPTTAIFIFSVLWCERRINKYLRNVKLVSILWMVHFNSFTL